MTSKINSVKKAKRGLTEQLFMIYTTNSSSEHVFLFCI